jgi:hypothetical protein
MDKKPLIPTWQQVDKAYTKLYKLIEDVDLGPEFLQERLSLVRSANLLITMLEQANNYVDFGDVARERLGMQAQYARQYLTDPELGKGIRWQGRIEDYHGLTIHKDDVKTFVERTQAWRRSQGITT